MFLRHRLLGEAVRRAVAVWAEGQVLGFNIAEPAERSNTVTTVLMSGEATIRPRCSATARRNAAWCSASASATCRAQAFRIAHMGHVNAPMILGTLGVIEVGLNALEYSPRQGRHRGRDRVARRKCERLSVSAYVLFAASLFDAYTAPAQK